uniref:Trichohyalin-plectin-homology domain-containing protein n=1 Tax=Globisporangium ultimum (strain ATCC 200006 / CBS 805.95 / DAOM BR144) TaxID=431595 RepID=K3WI08_GLOUD
MELMTTIKQDHDNGRRYFPQALTSFKATHRMASYQSSDSDPDNDTGLPCAHLDRECAINAEDFDECSDAPPILTSPRSIEACRMLGLEPEDLVKRPIEYFFTRTLPGHPPATTGGATANSHELATKRAARYEKNRQIQLKNVRAQRRELIDAELSGVHGGLSLWARSFCRSPLAAKLSMHCHDSSSSTAMREFTVIEREKRELERMQQRQLAEMQQMLAFELQMAKLHREHEWKEREKKRHDEQLAYERTQRQREADEMKRRPEILRKEQRAKKEEESRRRDALLEEKERHRKQYEARLQTELYQLAQAREVEKKEQEIARREEQRQHQLKYKKRLKAMEIAERQERNKVRITSVLHDKELLKEYQRQEAERKHQLGEERRQQFENERRQREHELRSQMQRKKEAIDFVQHQLQYQEERRRAKLVEQEQEAVRRLEKREIEKQVERERQKLEEQRQEEERRRTYERMQQQLEHKQQVYLSKAEEKSLVTKVMLDQKRQSVRARLQDAKLREEEIQAALARKQKQDAYRANLLLSKIESDNQRAQQLKEQRAHLIQRRQQIKQSASRQKQEILESFYRMRVTKKLELPKHLAASLRMRPQSAIGLQTRSWTDCDTSTHPERPKSAKRPMSAIGRPGSESTWKRSSETSPQHRSHTDTEGSDDSGEDDIVEDRDNVATNEHDDNIHGKLDDAVLRSEIDVLRRKHNEELLRVLEEEHHAEEQREHLLQQAVHSKAERARMETIFSKERARASERIMDITQRHERTLASRIDQLHSGG